MKTKSGKKGARLGQHFLRGTWAAHVLIEGAGIQKGDTVLEIGPGEGALTRELLKTGARVIAIEKDEALVETLRHTFAGEISSGRCTLIQGDVRDLGPEALGLTRGAYILAANIPYYITGEIIRSFLTSAAHPKTMALLVQKEVAERIARSEKESILSISVKAFGTPRFAAKVARGNFSPPPNVDSAILVVENISRDFFSDVDESLFFSVVKKGFSAKRKLLAGNLSSFGKERVLAALTEAGIPLKARAEDVPLTAWKELAKRFRS